MYYVTGESVYCSLFRDVLTRLKPAASARLLDMDKCIAGPVRTKKSILFGASYGVLY